MSNDNDKSRGIEKKGEDEQERKSPLTAVGRGTRMDAVNGLRMF